MEEGSVMSKRKYSVSTLKGREALFMDIIGHLLRYNDAEKKHIAEEAHIHWTTIYNWTHGDTMAPRIDTLSRVARVLGYDIALIRRRAKVPKLRRVK
jgi:hypothetical protein